VDGKEETNRFLQAAKQPLPQHPLPQDDGGTAGQNFNFHPFRFYATIFLTMKQNFAYLQEDC